METNDPITRLLEMLEHPEAYSEQEIHDLIHHDEATRQAYEWMVTARQSYRQKEAERPADVDAAWQRFQKAHPQPKGRGMLVPSFYKKIAAIFLAAAFLGGLAWAISGPLTSSKEEKRQPAQVITPLPHREGQGGGSVRFDGLRLDSILTAVSEHYGKTVCYRNEEPRAMKLITTWNPADSLSAFIEHLNRFDYLHLTLQGDTIFVEYVEEEVAQ